MPEGIPSLVPTPAHLPARNGLVNEVEFLGLIPQNGGRPMRLQDRYLLRSTSLQL